MNYDLLSGLVLSEVDGNSQHIMLLLGGNYVMGNYLVNAFRWGETVGPWEERPGHFNDVWAYWTDDGLGFFEFLQVSITLLLV
jgi:alpha-L-arabinofuranosidase